jgi:hypothetical protein
MNQEERLNKRADEQCDLVRQQATCPRSAGSSTGVRDRETCALFIQGRKIMSRVKERLTQQLLDGDLRSYLVETEHWNAQYFESIDWTNYSSAFKRLSKGRQTAVSKATHNIWHTGTRHQQYYGGAKHVQLRDRRLAPCHNMWITLFITPQGRLMGKNSGSQWSGGTCPQISGRQ